LPPAAGLALLLAGCGPNDVLLSTFQDGGKLANAALNNLHDATDQDEPVDPEAMRARSRQTCVEQKLGEADCAQLMAQTEKTIELVDRIQGLDQAAEAQRRQQLEQATNPASIVTGIAKGTLGHAGARGWAGAAASP
jgi:hypothetical protein